MTHPVAPADAQGAPPGRAAGRLRSWLLLPLLLLAALTLAVRLWDLDMAAQGWIYEAGGGSWALGDARFWSWIYEYGVYPATAVVLAATVGLLPRMRLRAVPRWRRACLFLILLGVLAPGVITNLILKEHWGRPRPRQVVELGGNVPFEPVLTMDRSTSGYSFPSGHATMGFYFFGLYLLLSLHRRGMARGFLAFGLAFGGLLGAARMLQGGHFLSDVIWSAGVCWFTGVGLFYALGFHRAEEEWRRLARAVPPWATVLGAVGGAAMVLGTLVATPYRESEVVLLSSEVVEGRRLSVTAVLAAGDFVMRSGAEFRVSSEASGHGVPTSRVASGIWKSAGDGVMAVTYHERLSGWFSELSRRGEIAVPWTGSERFRLDAGEASLRLAVDSEWSGKVLVLTGGEGRVVVEVPAGGGVEARVLESALAEPGDGYEGFTVILDPGFAGEATVEDAAAPGER